MHQKYTVYYGRTMEGWPSPIDIPLKISAMALEANVYSKFSNESSMAAEAISPYIFQNYYNSENK